MEKIIEYLLSIPEVDFVKSICILVITSCSGLIPNNNDISLAAAGLITQLKKMSPFYISIMATISWMIGETIMFLIGKYFGRKIFNFKFIVRKMTIERQKRITQMMNENPFALIVMIRLTPVLRACSILTVGSLGLSHFNFFSKHLPLLGFYSLSIFYFFYAGGTWLKTIFADNSIWVMAIIVLLWISMMIILGKRFLKKLK